MPEDGAQPLAISLLLFSDYSSSELAELAALSETLGYRDFWYTDVRFARDCYLGLAVAAARTSKIRLGTGVTDPYSRHPAITAASIATLDEMSDGRAVLGLGTGGVGFRQLGIDRKLPVAAMRETLKVIRGLLRGETVDHAGKVISVAGGRLNFTPLRPAIPVYFATHGAQITRLAAELADGILIANVLLPEAFAHYLAQVDQGLSKRGHDAADFDIGLRVEACIAEDEAAAIAIMRRRLSGRLLSQYPHWDYLDQLGLTLPEDFVALARQGKPDLERAAALLPASAVEGMALAGRPERVAQQLARALHPRVRHLTVRPHTVRGQHVASVIRAFAEQVVPQALRLRQALT